MSRHGCEVIEVPQLVGATRLFSIIDEVSYGGKIIDAGVVDALINKEKERRLLIKSMLASR